MTVNLVGIRIEAIQWCSPDYQQSLDLRHGVLREPLGLSFTADDLDAEHADAHYAAFENEVVIGVLIARRIDGETVKLRQMAVADSHQRQGVGSALVRHVESELKSQGVCELQLHSRQEAACFYERLGFNKTGDRFQEVGIPHIKMHKSLSIEPS